MGICISQNQFKKLKDGIYHVVVDASLTDGVLNYGELLIKGIKNSKRNIFKHIYVIHRSPIMEELSGPSVLTFLAKWLEEIRKTSIPTA